MDNIKTGSKAGLLVIRRINYFSEELYNNKDINPSVGMSHDQIIEQYKGIQGEPWPVENDFTTNQLSDGLVSETKIAAVLDYYRKCANSLSDLIYINIGSNHKADNLPSNFYFCGFDFGFYESEFNSYSVIFNEIIYGQYQPLRAFGERLNQNLLFQSLDEIEDVARTREHLMTTGADLETTDNGEYLAPISIYMSKADLRDV